MIHLLTGIAASTGGPWGRSAGKTGEDDARPRICVVGVGGAGCNALDHMIRRGVDGVDFIAITTDPRALAASNADECILLARKDAKGSGRPPDLPDVGRRAARQSLPQIRRALSGANMCFIAAGMGGGTGTGAAAVIAGAARDLGILTVVVVTMPFAFEGGRRQRLAEAGVAELRRHADTLIVIPNQNLLLTQEDSATISAAFQAADEVLEQGVRSITDLIVRPGIVNVDFADVCSVMQGMGKAVLGTGEGSGPRRALDAADRAVGNRLLDGALDGARKLLISIVGGDDMRLAEIDQAAQSITERVHPNAQIIWGSAHDPRLKGRIRVSVVATGIEAKAASARPAVSFPCRFGGHAAGPRTMFNQGFHFGRCRRCGNDLIRSGREWRQVPNGFKVVWRDAGLAHAPAIATMRRARSTRPPPSAPDWEVMKVALHLFYLRARQWLDEIGRRHWLRPPLRSDPRWPGAFVVRG